VYEQVCLYLNITPYNFCYVTPCPFDYLQFRKQSVENQAAIHDKLREHDKDYVTMEMEMTDLKRSTTAVTQLRRILSNTLTVWDSESTATRHPAHQGLQEVLTYIDALAHEKVLEALELKNTMMKWKKWRKESFAGEINKSVVDAVLIKQLVKRMGKSLRGHNYENVNVIPHARVPLVKCRDPIYKIDIDLTVNKKIPIYNSTLIRDYLLSDKSGTLKSTALVLKSIVKEEGICDASIGYLSSYSWIVLLLHFLLRFEFLPPFDTIRNEESTDKSSLFCEDIYIGYTVPQVLPWYYQDRIASVGVAELLIMFTEYLTTHVDARTDCLTMRGAGEVLSKDCWRDGMQSSQIAAWRLSIEVTSVQH
jgi:hypothetical protein